MTKNISNNIDRSALLHQIGQTDNQPQAQATKAKSGIEDMIERSSISVSAAEKELAKASPAARSYLSGEGGPPPVGEYDVNKARSTLFAEGVQGNQATTKPLNFFKPSHLTAIQRNMEAFIQVLGEIKQVNNENQMRIAAAEMEQKKDIAKMIIEKGEAIAASATAQAASNIVSGVASLASAVYISTSLATAKKEFEATKAEETGAYTNKDDAQKNLKLDNNTYVVKSPTEKYQGFTAEELAAQHPNEIALSKPPANPANQNPPNNVATWKGDYPKLTPDEKRLMDMQNDGNKFIQEKVESKIRTAETVSRSVESFSRATENFARADEARKTALKDAEVEVARGRAEMLGRLYNSTERESQTVDELNRQSFDLMRRASAAATGRA
ncbi:hypothetical protein BN1013_01398 [Candidatus Rubidus massiliensis]|nr:hypothetical protein BN1013_01398 [Candidatus Rubidus massiliensis]